MAKNNLRTLNALLSKRYQDADELLKSLGEHLEDTVLSPDEQQNLSKMKSAVDIALGNLSSVIGAAALGKLSVIIDELEKQNKMYLEQQALLLKDVSNPNISEQAKKKSEELMASFNKPRAIVEEQLALVHKIQAILNLPSNKNKQRKLLREYFIANVILETGHVPTNARCISLTDLQSYFYLKFGVFDKVDIELNRYSEYVTTINDVETSTAGDLDE